MPKLYALPIGPMLLATCVGPCAEFSPRAAVVNGLPAEVTDVAIDDDSVDANILPGSTGIFWALPEGRQPERSLTLHFVEEPDVVEFDLERLIPWADEADCWLLQIDPCPDHAAAACATAIESEIDSHTLSCTEPSPIPEADAPPRGPIRQRPDAP